MSFFGVPTDDETKAVARAAVRAFRSRGLTSCLCGGAACRQYGNTRTPNDVDIVVMTAAYTDEELKHILVSADSTFYLKPSRKIGATYKIVYARLNPASTSFYYPQRSCKVDVLVPGILNIPHIPTSHIVTFHHDLPVMPLIPLLLLKLQAWEDHRDSTRSEMRSKQYTDVSDITQLLRIAVEKGITLAGVRSWLPADFVDAGRRRVTRYLVAEPGANWKDIGF